MYVVFRWGLSALFLVLLAFSGSVWAQKRVALVIGNGAYEVLPALKNPTNDANDIVVALRQLGFEVDNPALDLGQAEMQAVIEAFAAKAADAELTLFYYGGHGLQVGGRNFLIPVDAQLESEADVLDRTIDLESIFQALDGGSGAKVVFLDACRDNPLPGGSENGLATMSLPSGFLVAYAAESGKVAMDGGGRNSPFAKGVLSHISTPGQDITGLLRAVRRDVGAETGGVQQPRDWSALTSEVVIVPGEAPTLPPETQLFQLAAEGRDPTLLKIYLERYPDGPHVEDVRTLVAELDVGVEAAETRSTDPNDGGEVEEALWMLARNSRTHDLVELYLARYPEGVFAEDAQALLPTLETLDDPGASPEIRCARLATHPSDRTADVSGVSFARLQENRDAAVAVCRAAAEAAPDNPHYLALLARALAAGRKTGEPMPEEAVAAYAEAAGRGDARAMVSLGLLMQAGDGVKKDLAGALRLYEQAAGLGNADGAINVAVALIKGAGVEKNISRAVELLLKASEEGAAIATFNLGVLYHQGLVGTPEQALDAFLLAASQGLPRAYVSAAEVLDRGGGVERDAGVAAEYLLRAAVSDDGDAFVQLTDGAAAWSPETIRAVQERLYEAGYYDGAIDAKSGPRFAAALRQWRLLGPPSSET